MTFTEFLATIDWIETLAWLIGGFVLGMIMGHIIFFLLGGTND